MKILDEEFAYDEGMMSHQEIIERFKIVFGRKMTQAERSAFFLDSGLSGKETTEP